MDRRAFLTTAAVAVLGAVAACSDSTSKGAPGPARAGAVALPAFSAPVGVRKAPVPRGTIYGLPSGDRRYVALTVDDGNDARVVQAYAEIAHRTGLRLTFFVNGVMRSWTEHADLIRPLHDRGQACVCNHTWSHRPLTHLQPAQITEEVRRNETFLNSTYGTLGRPFLRPPYGYRTRAINAQLADLGYPVDTMWLGTLGDSEVITPAQVLTNAEKWIRPGHIVIGHANHPAVIDVLDQVVRLIHDRGLTPVHLGDVYSV